MIEIIIGAELFVLLVILVWLINLTKDALALLQTISNRVQLVKEAIMYVHKNERLFLQRLLTGADAPAAEDVPDFLKRVRDAHTQSNK